MSHQIVTRRGTRVGRTFGSIARPTRRPRNLVNTISQTPANPTVNDESTVATASTANLNSNVLHSSSISKDPKICRFTGTSDGLHIEAFISIFERYFSSLDDNSKVLKLGEFLSGDALNFFGTDIIIYVDISWPEAKVKLIQRYGHSDIPPMLSAIRRRLQKQESIKTYFDDKCRFLRQEKGLSEGTQTQLLTDGLPEYYRTYFYGKRFVSTTEWLQTAKDIEADLNRNHRSVGHQSTAHLYRSDHNSLNQGITRFRNQNTKPKDKRPPYPCKHCRDLGITSHHWHNDCPNKPKEPKPTLISESSKPSVQHDCNYTEAKALVTPHCNGDQPILVRTHIKNKRIMAFVDTGANVNLMPESVVYEFRLTLDKHSARPVKTASGYAQTLGTVSFDLTIEGMTQSTDALVIRGFEYTLLLSRNTCHQFKLMIDTDLMSATTKNSSADCHQITDRSQSDSDMSRHPSTNANEDASELQSNDTIEPSIHILMKSFPMLFALDSTDLGRINVESHRILLSDSEPVAQRPYRQSSPDADETARQVTELLAKGLIRESVSPYAAPITLADKKDGTKRLCIDYRRLNKKTVADKTPLPLIADVIDRLQGSTVFSKLDFASAYWQIPVHPEDVYKTAFVTKDGHYEWLVLPYGLRNSPSTFHRVVRKILEDLVNKGVMSYLDDIVIYAKSRDEHD